MPGRYFFGVMFRHGKPIVKGASKKFQKLFEKEYGENRAAGLSTSSAHKEASSTINKKLKEFPKKDK